ncbi:putative nucleotidyltransferase with HDIG domain [Edaphobacter aggregans]|uniref:Putative nucleotidyltransferase with HDIG domain n=1 Tax=Edaphobacter aggregans TaxID=570835 RepID=A0A428MFU4_9BACT|nr:HD domain-containing phosphohydrolase [Edaphobacter aggregans]RSL15722.1 putative nucleotidyltransferase with HDIG domain [Edaphobacter aggregans]
MLETSAFYRNDARDSDGSISLSEVISALSFALDLTEGAVWGHALRSCLLGMRIADEIRLPQEKRSSLYFALLLKDVGWSSNASRMCRIVGDDHVVKAGPIDRIARIMGFGGIIGIGLTEYGNNEEIIGLRCDRGASIVTKLGLGIDTAEAVRSLDEHWDGDGYPDSLKGEQISLLARICAVAQHLDVFSAGRGIQAAMNTLVERSGTWFDPELVRVAVSLHRRGTLWANCLSTDSQDDTRLAVLDMDGGRRHRLEAGRIDQICEAFADVVDAKSHFTFRHSMGVADAAYGIARGMGLAPDRVQLVRRAALLHDIGKLSVSNSILDKKTQLNEMEWKAVQQHPGLTRQILERVGPFREMAVIAGEHHEKLDGSGYPNRLLAPELSLESRIIAVADVYGALSEDRPYRAGLEFEQIIAIMSKLVPRQLDGACFDALVSLMRHTPKVAPGSYSSDAQAERSLAAVEVAA